MLEKASISVDTNVILGVFILSMHFLLHELWKISYDLMTSPRKRQRAVEFLHFLRYVLLSKQITQLWMTKFSLVCHFNMSCNFFLHCLFSIVFTVPNLLHWTKWSSKHHFMFNWNWNKINSDELVGRRKALLKDVTKQADLTLQ